MAVQAYDFGQERGVVNTSDAGPAQRGAVPLSWHTALLKFFSAATEFQLTDDQGVEPYRQKRLSFDTLLAPVRMNRI